VGEGERETAEVSGLGKASGRGVGRGHGRVCPRHGGGGASREKKGRVARAGPRAIERERGEGLGARGWASNGPVWPARVRVFVFFLFIFYLKI
jgi:hypothetical protein